jgi:hypothetical protein
MAHAYEGFNNGHLKTVRIVEYGIPLSRFSQNMLSNLSFGFIIAAKKRM